LIIYRMGVEERMLIDEYGDEYREYMEGTWRLLPYIYRNFARASHDVRQDSLSS